MKLKSPYFGLCRDAHVILISMESASAAYVKPYSATGNELDYFQQIRHKGWQSSYHICLSANTNTSFATLFQGNYFNAPQQDNHLAILAREGYERSHICTNYGTNSHRLLCHLGFDRLYDSINYPMPYQSDVIGFNFLYQHFAARFKANKQQFIQIKNTQTHAPYHVYETKPSTDLFQRYRQAIDESDQLLPHLIQQLGQLIDLDNTIIVYTADHGQSFGEMGYKAHSSSIIYPQINVPFALYHPKLSPRQMDYSSHFDLMPTLFDLLGIEYQEQFIGTPLGCDDIPFSHILFSETRCGNLPSCFGHINRERKVLFDVAQNKHLQMDLYDNPTETISAKELKQWQQIMLCALEQRGLVNRPLNAANWIRQRQHHENALA